MTPPDQSELESDSAVLSATIRSIRRLRGLSSSETAAGMNLVLRTYQDFEAGRGRLNVDYIYRFCYFVNADPDAIFASLSIGTPDFALRCSSNKLMSIVMMGMQQLNQQAGDKLATLDVRTIVNAVNALVRELVDKSAGGEEVDWLKAAEEQLRRARPKPGR